MKLPSLVVIVRHAESTRNVEKVNAHPDALMLYTVDNEKSELSSKGYEEAAKTAAYLKENFGSFDLIASSTYTRADMTSKIIANELGTGYTTDKLLCERKKGEFDKCSARGIQELFPEEHAKKEKMGVYYYSPSDGESIKNVRERVEKFVENTFPKYAGKKILIVTHGANVVLFRQILEGFSDLEAVKLMKDKDNKVKNGSMTVYIQENKKMKLVSYNKLP